MSEQTIFLMVDKPIISLKPTQLKPHRLNIDIFGNLSDSEYQDLKLDIQARGIQDPLHVVKQNGEYIVVSGHQRLRVAKEISIDVPCIIRTDLKEEWQVEEQLIKDNLLRRHLNDYQKVNAGERLEIIERIKSKDKLIKSAILKERTESGQFKSSQEVPIMAHVVKVATVKPKSRDVVAQQVGMSHTQYDNAKKVKYEAPEPIKKKWEAGEISTGTALAAIKKEEKKKQVEEKIKHTNEISNAIDHIKLSETTKLQCTTGNWYRLGGHLLYCGDNSDEQFLMKLNEYNFSFAFVDPPYNATNESWDNNFEWSHDWIYNFAQVVAVTPGIAQISTFMKITTMPYKWSVSCWISNGMTRGAMGFGNWIYVALFTDSNIFCNSQDFIKVAIKSSESNETSHKGRKPTELMIWLFDKFSKENDYVLDPFLGSGTSLLVAETTKRICIGADKNPKYCDQIIARWELLTNKKVEKL